MVRHWIDPEPAIVRAAREILRRPETVPARQLLDGIEALLDAHWNSDATADPRSFDGVTFTEWNRRKSRRLFLRGTADHLVDGHCTDIPLEVELLLANSVDRLDDYVLRIDGREYRKDRAQLL